MRQRLAVLDPLADKKAQLRLTGAHDLCREAARAAIAVSPIGQTGCAVAAHHPGQRRAVDQVPRDGQDCVRARGVQVDTHHAGGVVPAVLSAQQRRVREQRQQSVANDALPVVQAAHGPIDRE